MLKKILYLQHFILLRELAYQVEEALILKYEPTESDIEAIHNSKKNMQGQKMSSLGCNMLF